MIYTLTPSPTLDLIMQVPGSLKNAQLNRVVSEELRPGGRGINISMMLKNLDVPSTALGFVAGFTGDELMRLTAAAGIKTGFLRVRRGRNRINLKIRDDQGETRINGLGPQVTAGDADYLNRRLAALTSNDYLILAGAVPPSMPQDVYRTFCAAVSRNGVKVVIDAPAEYWDSVLEYEPFLLKANLEELSEYGGCDPADQEAVEAAAQDLLRKGVTYVLISFGTKGALFLGQPNLKEQLPGQNVSVVDSTGAGDAMIAGFIADFLEHKDPRRAARFAVACGLATAGGQGFPGADKVRGLL